MGRAQNRRFSSRPLGGAFFPPAPFLILTRVRSSQRMHSSVGRRWVNNSSRSLERFPHAIQTAKQQTRIVSWRHTCVSSIYPSLSRSSFFQREKRQILSRQEWKCCRSHRVCVVCTCGQRKLFWKKKTVLCLVKTFTRYQFGPRTYETRERKEKKNLWNSWLHQDTWSTFSKRYGLWYRFVVSEWEVVWWLLLFFCPEGVFLLFLK